ncbi:MAG: DNA repair protein RecN, partial [Candidatus Schekmanbacteria bacterium RBG_13_48_7]
MIHQIHHFYDRKLFIYEQTIIPYKHHMINRLRIRDFAIIDSLDIGFSPGFNALTGETGAGKSIIIDAISLLLGERASQELIRTGKKSSLVEGEFIISKNDSVLNILKENGWEICDDLIIGREISRSGKSQAFLNGRMIPISFLQRIGRYLVDIHGQHDHQSLLSSQIQRDFLDQYGGLESLRYKVAEAHFEYRRLEIELRNLEKSKIERARQLDLIQYELSEIEQSKISDPTEYEILLQERDRLIHAEKLTNTTKQAYIELFEGENSIFDRISVTRTQLNELTKFDSTIKDWVTKLEELSIQFQEIADSCRDYNDRIEFDPERIQSLETRIETLRSLQRKYGPTLTDVLTFYEKIKTELKHLVSDEKESQNFQNQMISVEKKLLDTATKLSEERKTASLTLKTEIESLLKKLGMPKTLFEVEFQPKPDPLRTSEGYLSEHITSTGFDLLEFRISPNPDELLKPLSKIASGGEISRIMLCLKNLLAVHDQIPSMVFDEIDQGIGGPTAEVVGNVMKSVAKHRQILCITHLAQIAFQADNHLLVEKNTRNQKTIVSVT